MAPPGVEPGFERKVESSVFGGGLSPKREKIRKPNFTHCLTLLNYALTHRYRFEAVRGIHKRVRKTSEVLGK